MIWGQARVCLMHQTSCLMSRHTFRHTKTYLYLHTHALWAIRWLPRIAHPSALWADTRTDTYTNLLTMVDQNHIYAMYFRQKSHQIHGHIRCMVYIFGSGQPLYALAHSLWACVCVCVGVSVCVWMYECVWAYECVRMCGIACVCAFVSVHVRTCVRSCVRWVMRS